MKGHLHLPDLEFVKDVQSQFYVNRGIYNTIDAWFYKNGFKNIVERRHHIIQFLKYAHEVIKEDKETKNIYFPDGLVPALKSYYFKSTKVNISKSNPLISLLDN